MTPPVPAMGTTPTDTKTAPGVAITSARFVARAFSRNWKLIPVPLLLGVLLAVGGSSTLMRSSWDASGVMLYTPLPITESQKGLYPQPDIATLLALLKSPAVIGPLRDDLGLDVPVGLLEKVIKVTAPRNVQAVTVSVAWAEPEMAARMVNLLMERYIEQMRVYRRARSGTTLADYEARLLDCDTRHAKATQAYQEFFRRHNLFDGKSEIDLIRHDIEAYQSAKLSAARTEKTVLAQRERIGKELDTCRKKDLEEAEKTREFDASTETITDNRRRQDRLRELISDEQQRQQLIAELSVKRKDYEQRVELRNKGVGSQSAIDEVARDIEIVTSKLTDNEKVKSWKSELEKIDTVVVPKGKAPSLGSPIVQQIMIKQLELDLQYVGVQKDLFEADRNLALTRRRQEQLQGLINESEGLLKAIEGVSAERQQLAEQIGLFRRLHDQATGEFTVVSPATPAPYASSTTRKLWLVAGLMVGVFAALGRVCRREWIDGFHGGRHLATRVRVTPLGELTEDPESDRRVATALRRWQPEYGSVVIFTGAGGADVWSSFNRLAQRFSARDERVLVLDCRIGMKCGSALGLTDVLSLRETEWETLLTPGSVPGIDILPAGCGGDPDILATQLMAELVATSRRRYSLVVIIAPGPEEANTLDILLPYANGVLLCLGPQRTQARTTAGIIAIRNHVKDNARAIIVANRELPITTAARVRPAKP